MIQAVCTRRCAPQVVLVLVLLGGACSLPASPSLAEAPPLPAHPLLEQAVARLAMIERPITAPITIDVLPAGIHAMATTQIVVSRQWLDESIVTVDVLAGVLSHEQWHVNHGPHTCPDGRRDWRGTAGAWQYHAESLRLLGAVDIAQMVATASAHFCD
jgi:hypothetical protein